MKKLLILLVKFYQKTLSHLFPGVCRFKPTCSQYMIEAIETHGVFKGLYLGTKRLCKCHPWGGQGFDPVPPVKPKEKACQKCKCRVKSTKAD